MSPISLPLPFRRRGIDEEPQPAAPDQTAEAALPVGGADAADPGRPEPPITPRPRARPRRPATVTAPATAAQTDDEPEASVQPAPGDEPAVAVSPAAEAPAPEIGPAPARLPVPPPRPGPSIAERLRELATYDHIVLAWIAEDGYPMNVAIDAEISPEQGTVRFADPIGLHVPAGSALAITGSHVTPVRGGGFEDRRHITLWGTAIARPRGRFLVTPDRAWAWAEDIPLPARYEHDLPRALAYYDRLSAARGVRIRPRLPTGMLLMRATRAPFLSATLVPVALGMAVAARAGSFDLVAAVLTLIAACAVHLGLNAANDVFDTLQGADGANRNPTRFSGGSRVIQNALVSVRGLSVIAVACYSVAAVIAIGLLMTRGSPALVGIVAVGLFISLAYTMPPFKLVYRGLGEIVTAIGFGPVMLLGAYVVQSRGQLSLEGFVLSIPVGLLVAMILYVNEVPDRRSDQKVGKRTLPVRWSKRDVIRGFDLAVAAAFAVVGAGIVAGILPLTGLLVVGAGPLALVVHDGLDVFYDEPYALMPAMAANVRMHLLFGLLLLSGYVLVFADKVALGRMPYLW